MGKKTSIIWTMPKEEIQKIIDSSYGFQEILRKLNLRLSGSTAKMVKDRISIGNLSVEKMKLNKRLGQPNNKKIDLKDILIENSTYNRGNLKKRLIKDGVLKNECCICNQENKWNNRDLVMILDHINGTYNDNRIENLRLICPNCNSQTDTFGGRNQKKQKKCIDCGVEVMRALRCRKCYDILKFRLVEKFCIDCGNKITMRAERCQKCSSIKSGNRKILERPSKEDLQNMINTMTWVAIGEKYGVSDNSIRKWARSYELIE